jgi:septal ring factor EnvC (AmiA/AmiB activator)
MAIDQGDSLEQFIKDGTLCCPVCGADHDPDALRDQLDDHRISDEDFAQLCGATHDGRIGLVLRVGLHATRAIEDMGEPTIEFQESFTQLEEYLERIESTAEELEEQADEWREERDRLREVKEEIDELEKEQLPDAVERQLDSLGNTVEGQLNTVNEKLSDLTSGSYHSGTQQEFELVTRARNLNLGDDVIPKGGRNEEDITIRIRDDGEAAGTIVIESKDVKKHKSKHIDQLKDYVEERDAEIGLLVTTDMPSEVRHSDIDYWNFGDGILVLRPEAFEVVYLLARYALVEIHATEVEYQQKQKALESEESEAQALLDRIIEEVDRESVVSDLRAIIDEVEEQNEEIERIRNYNEERLNKLRERNREQVLDRLERSLREVRALDSVLNTDY